MTLHPTTETEHRLSQELAASTARAEVAEQKLREALADHTHQLLALDATIVTERNAAEAARARRESDLAVIIEELTEASRRLHAANVIIASERALRAAAEQRCIALGSALDRAEAELARVRGIATKLEDEVVETSMVAEAIISAPVERDRRIETGLIEALDLVERVARRGGMVNDDRAKLRDLRGLVPS